MTKIEIIIDQFLKGYQATDYVAINAFLERNEAHHAILQGFRKYVAEKYQLATTLGYGPRFLHSTGQLHKGGKNNGYFIVVSMTAKEDIRIPGQSISFQQMLLAQILGDIEALESAGRKVLYIHLKDVDLRKLTAELN